MRLLFAAALRLFMLLKIIQNTMSLIFYINYTLFFDYGFLEDTIRIIIPDLGSIVLCVVVFWKADWLAAKARIPDSMISPFAIDAKTIVAGGIILFGVYGIANLFLDSIDFFYRLFSGQMLSAGSGGSVWSSAYRLIRVLIYVYVIVAAGKIARLATRNLTSKHVEEPKLGEL